MSTVTVKSMTVGDDDVLVIVADVPFGSWAADQEGEPHIDHTIFIPADAIANRMVLYDLATPTQAVQALLKEHCVRLGELAPTDKRAYKAATRRAKLNKHTKKDVAMICGGRHPHANVVVGDKDIDKALEPMSDFIVQLHAMQTEGQDTT